MQSSLIRSATHDCITINCNGYLSVQGALNPPIHSRAHPASSGADLSHLSRHFKVDFPRPDGSFSAPAGLFKPVLCRCVH